MMRLPKFKTPSCFIDAKVLKDNAIRHVSAQQEINRRALKSISQNTTLPMKQRIQAHLQLTSMPVFSNIHAARARCVETGRGKGVIKEFKLCRTAFRNKALSGELPGVRKASW
ncbi:37S ribosomal protein MRP2 [Yarrowia sp. C11]|nr:37S ribosomal protein MRP2 [Yarrowia sp. E02]KAG5367497.1 37S ribosomal protein MRP2 [Yarrowia sp. C11]